MELKELYDNRFSNVDRKRNAIWRILCTSFFQKFIPESHAVVDIAAGRCEFINNIKAAEKYAFDLNPAVTEFAAQNVCAVNAGCFETISNFLEHLETKDDVVKILHICSNILSENGQIVILQPNIKYVKGEYWDFIDHKLALTDLSVIEAGQICGLKAKKVIKKFLPYTTKSKLPQEPWLVWLYLKLMPFSGFFFGKQSLIILEK